MQIKRIGTLFLVVCVLIMYMINQVEAKYIVTSHVLENKQITVKVNYQNENEMIQDKFCSIDSYPIYDQYIGWITSGHQFIDKQGPSDNGNNDIFTNYNHYMSYQNYTHYPTYKIVYRPYVCKDYEINKLKFAFYIDKNIWHYFDIPSEIRCKIYTDYGYRYYSLNKYNFHYYNDTRFGYMEFNFKNYPVTHLKEMTIEFDSPTNEYGNYLYYWGHKATISLVEGYIFGTIK